MSRLRYVLQVNGGVLRGARAKAKFEELLEKRLPPELFKWTKLNWQNWQSIEEAAKSLVKLSKGLPSNRLYVFRERRGLPYNTSLYKQHLCHFGLKYERRPGAPKPRQPGPNLEGLEALAADVEPLPVWRVAARAAGGVLQVDAMPQPNRQQVRPDLRVVNVGMAVNNWDGNIGVLVER